MKKNYGKFFEELFEVLESGSDIEKKFEKLVSLPDSPVTSGINTETGEAEIYFDHRLRNRLQQNPKINDDFVENLIESLKDAKRSTLGLK